MGRRLWKEIFPYNFWPTPLTHRHFFHSIRWNWEKISEIFLVRDPCVTGGKKNTVFVFKNCHNSGYEDRVRVRLGRNLST
jgi:hypothetical protein